jgi:hypothetical protein
MVQRSTITSRTLPTRTFFHRVAATSGNRVGASRLIGACAVRQESRLAFALLGAEPVPGKL